MTQIDRRALLGVAGSGLLLAGCSRKASRDNNGTGSPAGECEKFGDLVNKPAPGTYTPSNFSPKTLCVVFIVHDSEGVKARHGYWNAELDIAAQAKRCMKEISTGNYTATTNGPIRVEENFHRFGFNSTTKIYFFVNNPRDEFGFMPGGVEHKIRFAPISSNPGVKAKIQKNYAFYNMQKVDFSLIGTAVQWPFSANSIGYSLDYWNLDEGGNEIKNIPYDDAENYHLLSMNIHLLLKKRTLPQQMSIPLPNNAPWGTPWTDYLPMVVDPDTGNMGGVP